MNLSNSIILGSLDLAGVLIGCYICHRLGQRTHRSWPGELLAGGIYGLSLGLIAALSCSLFRWSGFFLLTLWCHVLFFVLAPLMLIHSPFQLREKTLGNKIFGLSLLITALGMEGTYYYAAWIEPYNLQITRHHITSDRLAGLKRPIKVIILADLQTAAIGDWERRVFAAIDREQPDLLLLAGDYIHLENGDGYREQQALLSRLIHNLEHQPPLGILGVMGNTDPPWAMPATTGVRILKNETVKLPAWTRLQVLGLTMPNSSQGLTSKQARPAAQFAGLTLVMGHMPDFALPLTNGETLLSTPLFCLAGHTHGGQIVIPGFGPPLTLCRTPRKYASGLHQFPGGWLLVSRGIGLERAGAPQIRLFCPPELVVLNLQPPTKPRKD